MKKILNLMFAAGLLSFAACSTDTTAPAEDAPIFPEKIAKTVAMGGEPVSLKVTPNLDGKISVPQEQEIINYFDIEINNEKLIGYSRDVKAGTTYDITVAGKREDFANSHKLVMTLTMGGQSQTIAEIELMPAGSTIEVYTAARNESGTAFIYTTDGGYEYLETPLAAGAKIALYDGYQNHLRVTANRTWKASSPSWMDLSTEGGNRGDITYIDIRSTDDIRPFEDSEGNIEFYAADDKTPLAEYKVSVAGCANEFYATIVSAQNVILKPTANTTTGTVKAAYGSTLFFASPDGEWIKLEGSFGDSWNDAYKSSGLHDYTFTAKYEENTAEEESRKAYLFCLPLGEKTLKPENALTAEGKVADDFSKYLIAEYTQQYKGAPRPEGLLFVQSMVGMDDNSTPGQEMFSMVEEYSVGNYPEGWWGDAFNDCPTVFKLTLKDMDYCEQTILNIENATDWDLVYHPDDENNKWIKEFGKNNDGELYRFIFEYTEVVIGKDEETGNDITEVRWKKPNYPEVYLIFRQNDKVTGALILSINAEALKMPLQNATVTTDIGFSILTEGNTGYSAKYADVPQYKVNGYDTSSGQADRNGRINAGALTLTYSSDFDIDFTAFEYEAIEDGQVSGKVGWMEMDLENSNQMTGDIVYVDKDTHERVDPSTPYVFDGAPQKTGSQMTYYFKGDGPHQIRIISYNSKDEVVCTVYVYYEYF